MINAASLTTDLFKLIQKHIREDDDKNLAFELSDMIEEFVVELSDQLDELKESEASLIQNAVYHKGKKKFYISKHRHDFVEIPLESSAMGESWTFIDGGLDYQRRGFISHPDLDLSYTLFSNATDQNLVDHLLWGTYGVNGDQPLTYVLLKDCSSDHLQNILEIEKLNPIHRKVCKLILEERLKEAKS